jgi:hypothetical protein
MKSLAFILTVAAAALATGASSEPPAMSAADLGQLCTGSDHVSRNTCRVYILGVTQGIAVGIRIADGKTPGGRPCVPPGVSGEELESAVKHRLENAGSANGQQEAAGFIARALVAAYPCKNAHAN